jgi:hypothetical protein
LFDAPVALHRVRGHRECTGVFDVHIHFQRLSGIDDAKALNHVQLLGVRRPVGVDESSGV